MPRAAASRDDPRRVFAHPDEDEVGVALPVVQRETIAQRVDERFRFAHLPKVVLDERRILERGLDGDDRRDVDAVDPDCRSDRVERFRDADQGAEPEPRQPEGLGEGAPDDDIWERLRAQE